VSVYVRICSRPFTTVAVLAVAATAAVLLAVFAAAPGGAATAPAQEDGPPVVYEAKDSPSDNAPVRTKVFVGCPGGYEATGGGFDVHAKQGSQANWSPKASRPSLAGEGPGEGPAGSGWVVEALKHNEDTKAPFFTAYAACAKETLLGPNGATYGSDSTEVNAIKVGELFTSCEQGSRVVGGGFDFLGNRDMHLVRTERANEHTWQIGAKYYNQFYVGKAEIKAYRVCVPDKAIGSLDYRRDAATGDTVANANTPLCPEGTHLLSGGAGVSNDQATSPLWSHIRPGTGDRNWSSGAFNESIFSKLTLWSFAVCGELRGQQALAKSSGKNAGWGDGMGGGRFK
jgi:hypothetical protein